ncbi:MAG: hypothetical protein ACJ79A_13330, partial [Gemmatimonadaceae bacterium]
MLKIQPSFPVGGFDSRRLALVAALLSLAACHSAARAPSAQHVYELRDGRWLGADGFRAGTRYVVDQRLTQRRPRHVDSVIDLAGRWVVPPFGEAHNHNVDYSTPSRTV